MNSLRLRYGLHWQTKYPPVARPLFGLFVILLLFTLASSMDYYYAKAAELERVEPIKQSYMNALIDCINGNLRMQWGDELFVGKCEPLGKA